MVAEEVVSCVSTRLLDKSFNKMNSHDIRNLQTNPGSCEFHFMKRFVKQPRHFQSSIIIE